MPKTMWRGTMYVYNYRRREFLVSVTSHRGKIGCVWSPGVQYAHAYKNPGAARKAAARINDEVYHHARAKYPCAPVEVVTGEAARCLDMINRRGDEP